MLPAIDLDNKFGFGAAEIYYEVVNDSLSMELEIRCPQEVIPKMFLLFGHVFPKLTGIGFHVFSEWFGHERIIS